MNASFSNSLHDQLTLKPSACRKRGKRPIMKKAFGLPRKEKTCIHGRVTDHVSSRSCAGCGDGDWGIGAGAMGAGIAQVAATNGHRVVLADAFPPSTFARVTPTPRRWREMC